MNDEGNDPTESSKHTGETDSSKATSSRDEIKPSDSGSRGRPKRRAAVVSRNKTSAWFAALVLLQLYIVYSCWD